MVQQVLVDVEELLVQGLLRNNTEVTDLVGTRIYTRVPAEPIYPLVRVRRIGGGLLFSHHAWLDRARVQYDVWSGDDGTKKATWRITDAVRGALIAGQCTTYAPMGRLDGVEETLGPFELPDPDSDRFRFVGEVLCVVRPLAVTVEAS